ncbi:MAG TPA: hypothetical protein VHX38_32135 [Pseudonocardiaceae bacterium]|jgi:hypothetical protein|nr:hypothetical protein [Pseudonocardiaceae bacterium]
MTRRYLDPDADFDEIFAAVRSSSWRWECQGHYAVDEAELREWQTGLVHEEDDSDRAWYAYIHDLGERGIPFERVRMLTEPLTNYLRWMLATTHHNITAGEDIRWIGQHVAAELGMPDYDFYLFDDDRVLILHFDDRKTLVGQELVDDPVIVERHRQWRALVWARAIRHADQNI